MPKETNPKIQYVIKNVLPDLMTNITLFRQSCESENIGFAPVIQNLFPDKDEYEKFKLETRAAYTKSKEESCKQVNLLIDDICRRLPMLSRKELLQWSLQAAPRE